MNYGRCYSAPPVDKFIVDEDIELEKIQNTSSIQRKHDVYFYDTHNPFLYCTADYIADAFVEKKTMVELIDIDHPDSEICTEYSGVSRTNTPIGDKPVVRSEMLNNINSKLSISIPITPSAILKTEINSAMNEIKNFYESLGYDINYSIKQLCLNICKDQEGSRFIQSKLDEWSGEKISWFFLQIYDSIIELSTNLFGNYVVQKIISFLNEDELFKIVVKLFGKVNSLSLHIYGCRVIQKLIENISDIKFIISELASNVLELLDSPNGNHVIQKCIEKNVEKDFIIKEFENNAVLLAQQRYGCRVLQKIFEICDENDIKTIYDNIIENIGTLINDKYGNYVIQHLIQTNNQKKDIIFNYIIENVIELSKYKYSSNVIEKCLYAGTNKNLRTLLDKFLSSNDGERPNLYYMCIDMYANYVVQKFFETANKEMRNEAKEAIKPYIKEMKGSMFSKQLLTRYLCK